MLHKIGLISLIIFLELLPGLICRINEPITPSPCPIENLMIDKSVFSKDWYQEGAPHERAAPVRWGIDKLGITFISQKNGVALQDVHRGRNLEYTEKGYIDLADSWFDLDEEATDWYIPPDFNYESTVADHYRFGCRTYNPSGVESCQFVGQYGIFLTRFHTFMSPVMTYDDLERILQTIDNKMVQCLGD